MPGNAPLLSRVQDERFGPEDITGVEVALLKQREPFFYQGFSQVLIGEACHGLRLLEGLLRDCIRRL